MKPICLAVFTACGLASVASHAEEWTKEPTTVFGIELGAPILSASVPDCPRRDYPTWATQPAQMCIRNRDSPYADRILTLEAIPLTEVSFDATIALFEGAVLSISLEFHANSFAKTKAIFIERYGPPTRSSSYELTANSGATATSELLLWIGKTNTITLAERRGRIDRGRAEFENNAVLARYSKKIEQDVKGAASKL